MRPSCGKRRSEIFDEYASDIHFEPYEERCRIRLRIDGKLIEKYVLDRGNYASLANQIKIMANLDICPISSTRKPCPLPIRFRSAVAPDVCRACSRR